MRHALALPLALLLCAAAANAQEAAKEAALEADVNIGLYTVSTDKNAEQAAEYNYLHPSAAGELFLEYDPLPHRFVFDGYYWNKKDFFADVDYSWKDVVVVNVLTRSLQHNLPHLDIGEDDPLTALPSMTDRDPGADYDAANRISRGFLRLKTPDFPFHFFVEARQAERTGDFQQRFLHASNLFPPAKLSQDRAAEVTSLETTVGMNSHLGPVEVEYSHTQRETEVTGDKIQEEPYLLGTNSFGHNLLPDLESTSDTIKIHSMLTGRLVAGATYTGGDKTNLDGLSTADFSMAAGDLTFMPINELTLYLKYRHYEQDLANPDTVLGYTPGGMTTYNVRDSLNTERDVTTLTGQYRVTEWFTVKAEYNAEATTREIGPVGTNITAPPANTAAAWNLPKETSKGTARVGFTYRIGKGLLWRADFSNLSVTNPAYETDPDNGNYLKTTFVWTPKSGMNMIAGYNGSREERDLLSSPLAGGKREASRDQAYGSLTLMLSKRASVTAVYSYFKNKVQQGITYHDGTGASVLEEDVPYTDKAQTGSLAVTVSPIESLTVTVDAQRSYSKGSFETSGSVAGSGGIDGLSDLKIVSNEIGAEVAVDVTRHLGYEVRYSYLDTDDKIDNTYDGTAQLMLAFLSLKW